MHESASQSVQNDKRNLFFYLKKVWFWNEAHVGGISVALMITTQKTKKQDWKEAKRQIEKEAKEKNIFYNLWKPKKKEEEGGGGTWCGVATTTTKTYWWWWQREQL